MTPFERWAVWVTSALAGITGIALGWMKYLLDAPDPWAIVNHPLQPLVLKLHIISSPLLVFALGLVAIRHVWHHLRTRVGWGRRSGLVAALTAAPMVLTGYLIQAVIHRGWLTGMVIAHVAGGLLYLAGLAVHQIAVPRHARLARRERASPSGRPGGPDPE